MVLKPWHNSCLFFCSRFSQFSPDVRLIFHYCHRVDTVSCGAGNAAPGTAPAPDASSSSAGSSKDTTIGATIARTSTTAGDEFEHLSGDGVQLLRSVQQALAYMRDIV